jgi:hypothetical protein
MTSTGTEETAGTKRSPSCWVGQNLAKDSSPALQWDLCLYVWAHPGWAGLGGGR